MIQLGFCLPFDIFGPPCPLKVGEGMGELPFGAKSKILVVNYGGCGYKSTKGIMETY